MDKEKIMLNNRTFKYLKNGIEFIAKKKGLSMTQFVNTLFFETIKKDIIETAFEHSTQQIALQYDIPNRWTLNWRNTKEWNNRIKEALGEEKRLQFGKDWADQCSKNIERYCKEIGLEDNDSEYAAIMKEFATTNDN